MTRKYILIIALLICSTTLLSAQNTRFINEGTIDYERTINVYAVTQRITNEYDATFRTQIMDQVKKSSTQFKTLSSTLTFSKNKTLFKPAEDTAVPIQFVGSSPEFAQINILFTDYNIQQQITQKKVFEETFLVKDSIRHINWKITNETREIAGYQCRRANAIIMDSIYVVAFYADQIPVSGGPEAFSGLPGMILGIALPHDNVTWFAKKVTDNAVDPKNMLPPAKGKATDKKGLAAILKSALKDWGNYANSYMRVINL